MGEGGERRWGTGTTTEELSAPYVLLALAPAALIFVTYASL